MFGTPTPPLIHKYHSSKTAKRVKKGELQVGDMARIVDIGGSCDLLPTSKRMLLRGKSCTVTYIYNRLPHGWYEAKVRLGETMREATFYRVRLEKPEGEVVVRKEKDGNADKSE